MCRRQSEREGRSKLRRGVKLLLLVTALLVLTASTGCRTVAGTDSAYREILVSMAPELPNLPVWPEVSWSFKDGLYCLSEEDVDKVLDYLENSIPTYLFELERYRYELDSVLDAMAVD